MRQCHIRLKFPNLACAQPLLLRSLISPVSPSSPSSSSSPRYCGLDLGPRIVVIWDGPADCTEWSWFSSSGLGLFGLVKSNCLSHQVVHCLSIWDLRALDFVWLTMVFVARSGINSRNGCVPKMESVMWPDAIVTIVAQFRGFSRFPGTTKHY